MILSMTINRVKISPGIPSKHYHRLRCSTHSSLKTLHISHPRNNQPMNIISAKDREGSSKYNLDATSLRLTATKNYSLSTSTMNFWKKVLQRPQALSFHPNSAVMSLPCRLIRHKALANSSWHRSTAVLCLVAPNAIAWRGKTIRNSLLRRLVSCQRAWRLP